MPARITATAQRVGAMNALLCAAGLFMTAGLLAMGLSWCAPLRPVEAISAAFVLISTVTLAAFFATWIRGRRRGGRLLLDCGLHPGWWLFAFNGGMFLFVAIAGSKAFALPPFLRPLLAAFLLVYAVFWFFLAAGRLQFREGGIWQYGALLPWDRVTSCRWADDATLLVHARSSLPGLGRGALPVPPEQKSAIHAVLEKHCPVWAPEFDAGVPSA
ncbi:MAG: hypothetical protein U0794_12020 [Isosphaeraceae bacterium]